MKSAFINLIRLFVVFLILSPASLWVGVLWCKWVSNGGCNDIEPFFIAPFSLIILGPSLVIIYFIAKFFQPNVMKRLIATGIIAGTVNLILGVSFSHFEWRRAALVAAASYGNASRVDYLLSIGASANAVGSVRETALTKAINSGSSATVKTLLKAGANLDSEPPCSANLPLFLAYTIKNPEMISLLKEYSAVTPCPQRQSHLILEYGVPAEEFSLSTKGLSREDLVRYQAIVVSNALVDLVHHQSYFEIENTSSVESIRMDKFEVRFNNEEMAIFQGIEMRPTEVKRFPVDLKKLPADCLSTDKFCGVEITKNAFPLSVSRQLSVGYPSKRFVRRGVPLCLKKWDLFPEKRSTIELVNYSDASLTLSDLTLRVERFKIDIPGKFVFPPGKIVQLRPYLPGRIKNSSGPTPIEIECDGQIVCARAPDISSQSNHRCAWINE